MLSTKQPPPERDDLFHRCRAAKAYVSSVHNPERQAELELAAFMDIFHRKSAS